MNLRMLQKFLIVTAALGALACSGDALPPDLPCLGNTICSAVTTAPTCGDTKTSTCNKLLDNHTGTKGVCIYRLAVLASCACVEGTVQYCADTVSTAGSGGGTSRVQDCIKTGDQAASWGGCHN